MNDGDMSPKQTDGRRPSGDKVPCLLLLGNNRHGLIDCDVYNFDGEPDGNIFIPKCPGLGTQDFSMTSIAFTMENSVYLMGCDSTGMYKLDTESLQCSRQSDMLAKVDSPCAASIGRFIVCIGSNYETDIIQIYDTSKDKWYWGTKAPKKFAGAACVTYERNIILSCFSDVWKLSLLEESDNNTITVKYEKMPNLVLARTDHYMGVINGDIYVIGGCIAGETMSTVEVLIAGTSQFILCTQELPITKHSSSLVTHQGKFYILPSPIVDTSKEHDTDHKATVPGEEHDDTLLVITPQHTSQMPKFSVQVIKMYGRRKYDSGAQGAKVFLPVNPPENLMSFLSKLQFLPPRVTDASRILSDAGRLLKNYKFDDENRIFSDCIEYIFEAIFAGSDATVCLFVLDLLASHVSSMYPYALATKSLLSKRKFVVTAGERYVRILKHLHSKGVAVLPVEVSKLFETEDDCVPFIQAAASHAGIFQQVCYYLSRMIDKDGLMPVLENVIDLHLKAFFLKTYMSEEFVEKFGTLKLAFKAFNKWQVHTLTCHDEFVDQQVPTLALMFKELLTFNGSESGEEFLKRNAPLLKKLFVNVDVNDPCGHADSIKLCELDWENRNEVPHCYHSDMIFYQRCNNFEYNTKKVETQKQPNDVSSNEIPDDTGMDDTNLANFEMLPSEGKNLLPKLQLEVIQLFEEISAMLPSKIPGGELLQFSIRLAGSLGEGTKIGRFDEFDIQLELKNISRVIERVIIGYTGNVSINKEDRKYHSNPISLAGSFCYENENIPGFEDNDTEIRDNPNTVFMNEDSEELTTCHEAETLRKSSDSDSEYPYNHCEGHNAACASQETTQDGRSLQRRSSDTEIWNERNTVFMNARSSYSDESDCEYSFSDSEEHYEVCGSQETVQDRRGAPSGSFNGIRHITWTTHGPLPKPGQPYPWELAREKSNDCDEDNKDSRDEKDYIYKALQNTTVFGDKYSRNLQNCLQYIDWSKYSLRVISTAHPWEFVWQEPGPYWGMRISVDVVPVITIREDQDIEVKHSKENINDYRLDTVKERLGFIVNNPRRQEIKLVMKWGRPGGKHRWTCSVSPSERDIMWSLPSHIRNAYKLVKLLFEIDYWKDGAHYTHAEKPITSYMVKNAVFWLLCEDINKSKPQKLAKLTFDDCKPENNLRVEKNEASRLWAMRILQYLKSETEKRFALKTFFVHNVFLYNGCSLRGIRDVCEKYLKFLDK